MRQAIITCDNINRLVKYIEQSTMTDLYIDRKEQHKRTDSINDYMTLFTGVESLEEAVHLLGNGWQEGSEMVSKEVYSISDVRLSKPVKRTVYDVIGHNASIPRYLQGIPTNMINTKSEQNKQRVINLYWDCSRDVSQTVEHIKRDAIKALQTIRIIESKGYRVNLTVVAAIMMPGLEYYVKVKIKSSTERLNISKVAYPMVHPSFLRRIIFRLIECDERIEKENYVDYIGNIMSHSKIQSFLTDGILMRQNVTINEQLQHLEQGGMNK